jgi:hypothetical protein
VDVLTRGGARDDGYINRLTGEVFPGADVIMRRCKCKESTVSRMNRLLVKRGYFAHVATGGRNRNATYKLTLPEGEKWPPE